MFHLLAGICFIILTILILRGFLAGESLFIYRDVLGFDPQLSLYNAITSFSLEAVRRILFLGPFLTIITALNLPPLMGQKITFVLIHFMIGFLAYFASYKFLSSRLSQHGHKAIFVASLIFGFFYLFNPRVAQGLSITGWGYAFSYALIPIIFYYYDKSLREAKLTSIFVTSILISLAIAATAQFLASLPIFVLLPWFLATLIRKVRKHESVFPMLRATVTIFGLCLAISFYWIYPTIQTSITGSPPQPDYLLTNQMLDTFSSTASLSNVVRLMSSWWPYVNLTAIINESLWTSLTFVIPIAAIGSLVFMKDSRLRYDLIALGLISAFIIFFAKGTQPPLPQVYPTLYDIPVVGWMFRLPSSIAVYLPFYFGMIIAFGLYKILSMNTKRITSYAKVILPSFLIVSVSLIGWPMFTGDFGGVYKNNNINSASSPLESNYNVKVSQNVFAVFGNNDTVASFSSELNPDRTSVLQVDYNGHLHNDSTIPSQLVLDNNDPLQALRFQYADKESIMIKPFLATRDHDPGQVWSIAGTNDPLHGPFHTYLKKFGVTNADNDYGEGLVFTWAESKLDIPFEITTEDSYHMFVRLLRSQAGGTMTISTDNKAQDISTKDGIDRFVWKDMGIVDLAHGRHTITLKNSDGLNAVNLFLLIPMKAMPQLDSTIKNTLEQSTLIYYLNNKDFFKEGKFIQEEFVTQQGGNFDKSVAGQLKVPHQATSFSLQFQVLQNDGSNSSYIIKDLKLAPRYEKFLLAQDFEDPSQLQAWHVNRDKFISIQDEDKNPISRAHSMRIDIANGTSAGWEVISTKSIPVVDNLDLKYQFTAAAQGTSSPHAKVIYYDINNKIIKNDIVFRSPSNNYLQTFEKNLRTPPRTESMVLQFWVQPNFRNNTTFKVDDLKIERVYPSKIFDNNFETFRNLNPANLHTITEPQSLEVQDNENHTSDKWLTIQTYPISVNRDLQLDYNMQLTGRDINQLDARALYYDNTEEQKNMNDKPNSISIAPGASIFSDIDILKSGSYTIALKTLNCQECGPVTVNIAGESTEVPLKKDTEQFQWHTISTNLSEGKTTLNIYASSQTYIDSILIYSSAHGQTLDSIIGMDQVPDITYQYEKIDPTKYVIKTNATKPFMLVLERDFDSLWSASVNGKEYRSLMLFPKTNGFYIDEKGPLEITVEYKPQQWFIQGSIVTITSIIAVTGVSIWQNRKRTGSFFDYLSTSISKYTSRRTEH